MNDSIDSCSMALHMLQNDPSVERRSFECGKQLVFRRVQEIATNLTQSELAAGSGVIWSSLKRFEREGLIALDALPNLAMLPDCLEDFDWLGGGILAGRSRQRSTSSKKW